MLRSQDEHSEDIAALVLQISEITSFASTTQLLQHRRLLSIVEKLLWPVVSIDQF